jgi:chromosomal replication initiator protein
MELVIMSEQEIWEKVLSLAREEISETSYTTFLKDTEIHALRDNEAIIVTDEDFVANWLNTKYAEIVQSLLYKTIGEEVTPKFYSKNQLESMNDKPTVVDKEEKKTATKR